jgi:hypothetical protein
MAPRSRIQASRRQPKDRRAESLSPRRGLLLPVALGLEDWAAREAICCCPRSRSSGKRKGQVGVCTCPPVNCDTDGGSCSLYTPLAKAFERTVQNIHLSKVLSLANSTQPRVPKRLLTFQPYVNLFKWQRELFWALRNNVEPDTGGSRL